MKTTASRKALLVRSTWPKVRIVTRRGGKLYEVDGRKTGTQGKQEHYPTKSEALARATTIEAEFATNGNEGLAMSATLREMAFRGEKILAPYTKTIFQAAEFYRDYLVSRKAAEESALVETLAGIWRDDKVSGKNRRLRPATLKDIRLAAALIGEAFAGERILDVTTASIQTFLDGLNVGLQRKFNIWNLLSQFLNWCVKREYMPKNPALKIEIEAGSKEVAIFTPIEALKLMTICVDGFKDFVLYHAIGLFAGLRPEECQALKWEQIHLEEQTITVLAETSKIKETRNVHIEDALLAWLSETPAAKRKGFVTPQTNLTNNLLKIHIAAGYRGAGENPAAQPWPQDVLRHSYGSYWLAKFRNRAQLAENMGNSLQIIKKHYKRVVSKSDCAEFWRIVPGYNGRGIESTMPTSEEVSSARSKRLAKALA